MNDRIPEVVAMILEQLRAFVEGDELALSDLSDALDQSDYNPDEVDAAFDFIFQALDPVTRETYGERQPGSPGLRVLNAAERLALSPEGYGYLLRLKQQGVLTDSQIESVLEHVVLGRGQAAQLDDISTLASEVVLQPFEANRTVHDPPEMRH